MARSREKAPNYQKVDGNFTLIPNETLCSDELNALKVHARWVYTIILTRLNRDKANIKKPYPFTYKELKAVTGFDDRRLAKCLKDLEKADFIEIEHGGKNNPSEYIPNIKWLFNDKKK